MKKWLDAYPFVVLAWPINCVYMYARRIREGEMKRLLTWIVVVWCLFFGVQAQAGEAVAKNDATASATKSPVADMAVPEASEGGKNTKSEISNIGFMENPPKTLKEKFPMCNAFLKVEWIDKKKKIGYSNYEAIVKNKKNEFIGEKKMVWALVDMNGAPGIDYDVYEYKRQGRLNEIFERVKNGKVKIGIPMMITYKGETISLYGGKAVNEEAIHPLLSDHLQTVCVVYPDEQRAWIVEGKSIKQTLSPAEQDSLYEKVTLKRPFLRSLFESLWVLDINFDKTNDYIHEDSIVYSRGGALYQPERVFKYPNFKYIFPPGNGVCRTGTDVGNRLTTDGKHYYLNDQCDLTKLTSQTVKE